MPRCRIPILIVAGFLSRLPRYTDWSISLVEGFRTLSKGGVAVAPGGFRIRRALPRAVRQRSMSGEHSPVRQHDVLILFVAQHVMPDQATQVGWARHSIVRLSIEGRAGRIGGSGLRERHPAGRTTKSPSFAN
jgi:hypothetical protein